MLPAMIPKRVILMVLYFAVLGGSALSTMWQSLNGGHFFFDLSILMLPVAYGLLRGRPNSRIEAQVWFALTYVVAGIGIWKILEHHEIPAPGSWVGKSTGSISTEWMLIAIAAGILVLNVVFHILIRTKRARDFFKLNEAATRLLVKEDVGPQTPASAATTAAGPEVREAEIIEITEKEPAKADLP
ncbi:MAG: hypothetical protein JWO82_2613 [Akkermansiaceae bacterium]|nr:hypothetical protein [Akkermansiaceae bacterium]